MGELRSRVRSAGDVVRFVGLPAFALRVFPWSFRREYAIFGQDLGRIVSFPPPAIPYRLAEGGHEDIPDIMALRPGFYAREGLERRLADGHMVFVGRSEAKTVYCHWVLVGAANIPYAHGRLVLPPEAAYADEAFVEPASRRSGIYAHSGALIREALRSKGFRTLYAAVASWNEVPRRFMVRSGMSEVARLWCRNVPGFTRVRWSGGVDVREDGSFAFHAPA